MSNPVGASAILLACAFAASAGELVDIPSEIGGRKIGVWGRRQIVRCAQGSEG